MNIEMYAIARFWSFTPLNGAEAVIPNATAAAKRKTKFTQTGRSVTDRVHIRVSPFPQHPAASIPYLNRWGTQKRDLMAQAINVPVIP
jgi:hypothetical protein